ncbi:MAG: hypothetical protein H0T94_13025 [Acidimicrobiia bacterium]|nr:hypothetical protein [Acidimicrobiia bacterium]
MERTTHQEEQTPNPRAVDNGSHIKPTEVGETIVEPVDEGYLGHFESLEAFAQIFVDDNNLKDRLEPSWLRSYIGFDLGRLARDLVFGLVVVKDVQGGIHVFDPTL